MEIRKEHWGGSGSHVRYLSKRTGLGNAGRDLPNQHFICSSPSVLRSSPNLPILACCHPEQRSHLANIKMFMCDLDLHIPSLGPWTPPWFSPTSSIYSWLLDSPNSMFRLFSQTDQQSLQISPGPLPTWFSHLPPPLHNQAFSLAICASLILVKHLTCSNLGSPQSSSGITVAQVSNKLHLTQSDEDFSVLIRTAKNS